MDGLTERHMDSGRAADLGRSAVDGSTAGEDAADLAVVARQPIFDATQQVVAYELLYRAPAAMPAPGDDPRQATARLILGAVFDVGLRQLVGDRPAHINVPAQLLATVPDLPLNPQRVVIKVSDGVAVDEEALHCLIRLRRSGFQVAVDDFNGTTEDYALLACADMVSVAVQQSFRVDLAQCARTLRGYPVRLIAGKVATRQQFELCRELGFEFFQGQFLQTPELASARHVRSARVTVRDLIGKLSDPGASAEEIERCISRDVGFSYRILKCINSSYFQMPRQISSIREAVVLLGLAELQKLCCLMLLAGLDGQPDSLCVQALTRARMCELLCIAAGRDGADSYFMTGMMSLLDAILRMPMEQALGTLSLSRPVISALLWHEGEMGSALWCVNCYERGAWSDIRFASLELEQVAAAYRHAVTWAEDVWKKVQTSR
jgi:EAL and modified HD-GYP domain-containing signal transduction protein